MNVRHGYSAATSLSMVLGWILRLGTSLLTIGCGADPCALVSCGEGAMCVQGECRCGSPDGAVCEERDRCDLARGECVGPLPEAACSAGTRWEPGAPAFREATAEWGLEGVEGVRLTVTDIDGDGWADLEVRRGALGVDDFSSSATRNTWLLRNSGGRFDDVTESSGFLTRRNEGGGGRPVQVVAWGDLDNDGDLDAYSGLGTDDWEGVGYEQSEVLINDGSGHFSLGAIENPIRRSDESDSPAGASFVDVDHDGFLDLWVPQHNGTSGSGALLLRQDHLWRGDGTGRFVDATDELGLTTLDWLNIDDIDAGLGHTRAWSAAACDLNGDGLSELLAASYGRSPNHLWQARREVDAVRF
jgi:hypothetical protein